MAPHAGYVGIFSVIVVLLTAAAVFGFWRELVLQQDILLTQEARNQARNLLNEGDTPLDACCVVWE